MYSDMSNRIERGVAAEQEIRQGPGQLGLADPRRPEEHEAADRPARRLQPGARTAYGPGERRDGAISWLITPLVQVLLHPFTSLRRSRPG